MKIHVLSFRLPVPDAPKGLKRGGVERVAHDIANGLAERGHEVTVWSADPLPPGAYYDVRPLPGARFVQSWLGFRLVSGYLGNLLAMIPDYDGAQVIIAHGDSLLLPLRGIPILRIMHGSAWDEARTARSLLRKSLQFGVYLQELLTSATQTTIGVSRATRRRYWSVHDVIPNGVDTSRFYPCQTEKTSEPSILFVGALNGRKRGHLLVEWFTDTIRRALPGAKLCMVSEPGPAAPGVEFLQGVSDTDLAALYRRAWVFASPSAYEGFGLPYLEALASGTAVVATANPGSREVLDEGRYGCLIQRDKDFAPALLQLLSDHPARGRRVELGLQRSRDFSLERSLDRYEAVLHNLARSPRLSEVRP